ncbi:thiol-disulfide oxidoreductase DCC family protein [Paenibacillus konkukensis]|uniref:thiol-disulfide oxidoreductase DCC family protein n=1 Tax=Paenibacillus konkukensis TaxID=2020716 RepID=UPI00201D4493|nr:DCC1-like thiol-disulfide oxidoreductase family protein [Paenibacillus konkukensis]
MFDGECRFCSGWVKFLIRHDRADRFRFAPLQSEAARSLLPSAALSAADMDSVVLLDGEDVYTHSSAVLRICRRLGGGWALLGVFSFIPSRLRDALYRWVAKHRYLIAGREQSCIVPTEEIRRKFIG